MAEKKTIKLPKSPAACADMLYKTREARLKLQKDVDKLQAVETALNEFFRTNLPKNQTGVSGRIANVQTRNETIPQVEDWDAFYKHIKKTGQFELMQRRVSTAAVEERWAAKKTVPGVGKFNVVKVSCTLLKKR